MNFWTFLDRNGEGLFCLVVICFCFAFGACGDGHGCTMRLGCGEVATGAHTDAGAP
jgi:hypothetical protein